MYVDVWRFSRPVFNAPLLMVAPRADALAVIEYVNNARSDL